MVNLRYSGSGVFMLSFVHEENHRFFHDILIPGLPGTTLLFAGQNAGLLPFLKYGLGEDRLGGAKMTYLDSNILVKVADSIKDDYKDSIVELSFCVDAKRRF